MFYLIRLKPRPTSVRWRRARRTISRLSCRNISRSKQRRRSKLLQSGVPGYPTGGEGAGVRGPPDRTLAAVHLGAGLRLLLYRTPARLTLGKKEYFIDLLFYHRFLKALVAVELKVGPFEPEYAGKMNFYLNSTQR